MRYTFLLLIIGFSHFGYAHHYDDIEVGSFDRFEEIVNGPTDHILDIVFSGINIEAKNWESARSFLPVEGAKFRQLNAYFEAPKPFAYYFNTGKKGESIAGPMREYLNNVFKNKDAMKELWEANEEIFRELDGVRSWRDVRGKAENNELGDFLNKLIKE